MRILLLNWRDSAHPAAGGAEVWAHKVAEGLVDLGHEVTFFSAAVSGAASASIWSRSSASTATLPPMICFILRRISLVALSRM